MALSHFSRNFETVSPLPSELHCNDITSVSPHFLLLAPQKLRELTRLSTENVSKALRAKYREQLDDNHHQEGTSPTTSNSIPPLRRVRGSDFLAMVNTRRSNSAPLPVPRTPSNGSSNTVAEHESVQEATSSGSYYDESSGEFVRGTAPECAF